MDFGSEPARTHLEAGDHAGFAAQVDRSYDLRASIAELDPRHVRMIEECVVITPQVALKPASFRPN
jgi:hypothetical protein